MWIVKKSFMVVTQDSKAFLLEENTKFNILSVVQKFIGYSDRLVTCGIPQRDYTSKNFIAPMSQIRENCRGLEGG